MSWKNGTMFLVGALVVAAAILLGNREPAQGQGGKAGMGGGVRHSVISTDGAHLIVTDNEADKLYFYAIDKDGTLKCCLEIAEATVLRRPYETAPVSNLFLFDRKEDLAFEHPVGNDPRKRHHVRFWKTDKLGDDGRPVWVGAAIYDEHVGFSKTTGQITHVTGADIDQERDKMFRDLTATGDLEDSYYLDGFHTIREGRNGGGDPWRTDGRLEVGIIR